MGDHPLVQLVDQRRGEVTLLLEHISDLQDQLVVAKRKLEESKVLLKQLQAEETDSPSASRDGNDLLEGHEINHPVGTLVAGSRVSTPTKSMFLLENAQRRTPISKGGTSRATSCGSGRVNGDSSVPRDTLAGRDILSGQCDAGKTGGRAGWSGDESTYRVEWMEKELVNLVPCIKTSDRPISHTFNPPVYVPSQRKRKLKCLEVNPAGENQCATTALDGILSFWRIEGQGNSLSLQHTVDCLSPGQRRWPEDLDWHPSGESLVACYSADCGDSQVAVVENTEQKKAVFLPDKPHEKGIINGIMFLPWSNGQQFVTGGCDHAVVLWKEREDKFWQPKVLHRALHTSAVMGIAGMSHREWVLSSGADKRVFGFDIQAENALLNHQLDTKVISVMPNPVDFNLYMVQTGTQGYQIKLFDIRTPGTQLHTFGWCQENSDSQTALIRSLWSPTGLCAVTGSTDPKIHIFDIRYILADPSKTIRAHTKRVFKAAWHHTLPLLISISSDLQIGLHRHI